MSEEVFRHRKTYVPELDRELEGFVHKMLRVLLVIALLEPLVYGAIVGLASSQ